MNELHWKLILTWLETHITFRLVKRSKTSANQRHLFIDLRNVNDIKQTMRESVCTNETATDGWRPFQCGAPPAAFFTRKSSREVKVMYATDYRAALFQRQRGICPLCANPMQLNATTAMTIESKRSRRLLVCSPCAKRKSGPSPTVDLLEATA